jgi:hypothetical protein
MQFPAMVRCAAVVWLYVDCSVVTRSIQVDTTLLSELSICYTGG